MVIIIHNISSLNIYLYIYINIKNKTIIYIFRTVEIDLIHTTLNHPHLCNILKTLKLHSNQVKSQNH